MLQIYESPKTKKIIDKSKELKEVISDLSLLDPRNPETKTDRTVLKDYNRLFTKRKDGADMISSASGEITLTNNTVNNIEENSTEEAHGGLEPVTFLPDDQEVFIEKPTTKGGKIDTWYVLEKSYVSLKADSAEYAAIHRLGNTELYNCKGNYMLNLMIDSSRPTIKWNDVYVYGQNTDCAAIASSNNGIIFRSVNMNDISVMARSIQNYKTEYKATFSTGYNSVNIREMDEDTLGIYIDRDGDGDYETPIADSNGTDYGRFDKEQESSETITESTTDTKNENSKEQSEQETVSENSRAAHSSGSTPTDQTSAVSEISNTSRSEIKQQSGTVQETTADISSLQAYNTSDNGFGITLAAVMMTISVLAVILMKTLKGKNRQNSSEGL